jgi:lipid II:glycine glycyltransferase (peptidoglycan interpeptide bridge formation enzyme)
VNAGYRHFGAVVRDSGRIVGGALVLKRAFSGHQSFYYAPEGPVLPRDPDLAEAVFERVLEAVHEHRRAEPDVISHLRIEPRWLEVPAFVAGFRPLPDFSDCYTEPRTTLCVDLRQPVDVIQAQMKPKGRYNIRLAERHGVTVVEDTSERGVADFITIYAEMAARQGIGRKPDHYFWNLVSHVAHNRQGGLFFAEYRGERLAAALVIRLGDRATYFYGGSRDDSRQIMAPYLLHWEIMRWAKAGRCAWYDLWGIAPQDQPDHPWQGISGFKRKFGGVDFRFVPTLDLVLEPVAYEAYQRHCVE